MAGRGSRRWRAAPAATWGVVLSMGACGGTERPPGPDASEPSEPPATDQVLEAAWSPDGSRIVVAWDRGQGPRLYGLLPGTPEEVPQPSQGLPLTYGQERNPTWSPDRLWLAYEGRAGGNVDIYRIRPDGSGSERLTTDPAADTDPAWSPDGRTIAFVSERGGNGPRLHLMDADGSDVRPVSFTLGSAHSRPVWAPDGRRLVVQVRQDGRDMLYVVDAQSGNSGRLGTGTMPVWAPSGQRVYFAENDSIFWRPPDGGLRRFLVADARAPEPGPDGRRLAFVRGNPPQGALYLLDLETTAETRITP